MARTSPTIENTRIMTGQIPGSSVKNVPGTTVTADGRSRPGKAVASCRAVDDRAVAATEWETFALSRPTTSSHSADLSLRRSPGGSTVRCSAGVTQTSGDSGSVPLNRDGPTPMIVNERWLIPIDEPTIAGSEAKRLRHNE